MSGGVAWWQARRSDKAARRVGTRLVFLELRRAALATGLDGPPIAEMQLPTTAWTAHREILARVLPDDDWTSVVEAYEIIEWPVERIASKKGQTADEVQVERRGQAMKLMASSLRMQRLSQTPERRWKK